MMLRSFSWALVPMLLGVGSPSATTRPSNPQRTSGKPVDNQSDRRRHDIRFTAIQCQPS